MGAKAHIILRWGILLLLVVSAAAQTRPPAPDFTAADADGNRKRLSDYHGKVVLVNFWATWCGPCRFEIPMLQLLHDKYADMEFTVVGVSIDVGGWPVITPFLSENAVTYPVLLARAQVISLHSGKTTLPQTLILDREGRVANSYEGLLGEAALDRILRPLLEEEQEAPEEPAIPAP